MTRQRLTIGAVAAAFALSVVPAWAAGQAGARPNSTGSSSGSAAPRGGDTGSSSSSSGSSSSSSSGSSGSGMTSGGSSMGSGYSAPARERAPERPSAAGGERRSGGGDRAVSRGGDRSGAVGSGTSSMYYGGGRDARDRGAVPEYSRPNSGRPVVGQAMDRSKLPPGQGGNWNGYYPIYDPYYYYGYYDPYYYGYGSRSSRYWMPGYGYGLGYFGYDPFLFGGYYDPYYDQLPSGGGGYGYGRTNEVGALRLKVKPSNAQVYIDGYFVGAVDSFDGMFQRLAVEAGSHRVEVRAEGFETVQFDVLVTPGETITYKGELTRIQ
jgi:hypothetical protein